MSWPTRSGSRVALACVVIAIVRVAALPLPGTEDTGTWKIWMFAASSDVTSVYGVGGEPPTRGILEWQGLRTTVDYPPVALYELGLAGRVYRGWASSVADGSERARALAPHSPENWPMRASAADRVAPGASCGKIDRSPSNVPIV